MRDASDKWHERKRDREIEKKGQTNARIQLFPQRKKIILKNSRAWKIAQQNKNNAKIAAMDVFKKTQTVFFMLKAFFSLYFIVFWSDGGF